jgi:hypothetical protein
MVIATRRGDAPDTIPASPSLADSSPIWIGRVAGTYDFIVRRAGYADLSMLGIVVPAADVCHPSTVALVARLTKTN